MRKPHPTHNLQFALALLFYNLWLFIISHRIQIEWKENTYYFLFTSKTNRKMPSEMEYQFQNMVFYIWYFKFWVCILIEKWQLKVALIQALWLSVRSDQNQANGLTSMTSQVALEFSFLLKPNSDLQAMKNKISIWNMHEGQSSIFCFVVRRIEVYIYF